MRESIEPSYPAPHMARANPTRDLAEIRAMLRVSGFTSSRLAAFVPAMDPSTLNKAIRRLEAGGGISARTLERLREAMRGQGFADQDWQDEGPNIRMLGIALRAVARALPELMRPEGAPDAARLQRRIYRALERRPELSDEAAQATADLLAEELRVDIRRDP